MDIPEEIQRGFFYPVCNKEEIERIFNVANGADYLLKLRAETIVDNMRLFRVYRNKALARPNDWSLDKSFDDSHYHAFLNRLPDRVRQECNSVVFGDMFSNDPNGTIFASDYGPIITISESLTFFLKFAHLALMDFQSEVPSYVRMNALRIAIRVMLRTEAMDFYMDPRGIVPSDVGDAIHAPIPLQMEFIAGHEFAHYILNHLSSSLISNRPLYHAISSRDIDYKPVPIFMKSQQQELDADTQAILLVEKDPHHRIELLNAALLWFACLDLYEIVADALYPTSPWRLCHPSARDRFENLLTHIPKPANYDESQWSGLLKTIDTLKHILIDDASVRVDLYEMYGSLYLDKPNSEWRGRELIDRKDYY
jgi:hypothetical protein